MSYGDVTEMAEFGDRKKYSGITLRIEQDESPENPRAWDNVGTFAMYHRHYDYGDKKEFKNPGDLEKFLEQSGAVVLPVYMLDHSGIWFRTGPFREDPGGWDSGQVGVIYATREKIVKEYGKDDADTRKLVARVLQGEIEDVNNYAQGNVAGYVLEDAKGIVDSCWGFYPGKDGDFGDAMAEALASYDDFVGNFATEEAAMEYVKKNRDNFGHIPDECRTSSVCALYLDMGGDIREIPERFQKIMFCPQP